MFNLLTPLIPTEAELISSIEYRVNPDKRTVTAIMSNTSFAAADALERHYNGKDTFVWADAELTCALEMPERLVVTVHCHEDDEFTPDEGIHQAKRKLCKKLDKERRKAWNRYKNVLVARLDAATKCILKYDR